MKKKGKIAWRTLLGLVVFGLVLMIAISTAIGYWVREEMIETYSDTAYSFTASAAEFIDGDQIAKYLQAGQKDDYYESVNRYLNIHAKNCDIEYFYVFIPGENNITYIWDADTNDTDNEEPTELLEQEPYTDENAQAEAHKLMEGTAKKEEHFFKDTDGSYVITGNSVIYDSAKNPVAIVAADVRVTDVVDNARQVVFGVLPPTLGVIILMIVFYFIYTKKKLVDPIVKLQKATGAIVDNIEKDTKLDIDIHTNDEVEMLAESFEKMDTNLRTYIQQNEAITAEKERIGTELELATKIQADMLPNIFPAFPDRSDFDIFASMTPAKAVGGDFYDFFLTDENHLAFLIADVSGKGIPAALFMMMSKILIQNAAMRGLAPGKALEIVNKQICANNREEMFVTVWLGILDLNTGVLTAANAGHEKPMLMQPGGAFEMQLDRNGFIIGGIKNVSYQDYQIKLEKGAKLFVYTDGVVEATSEADEQFGFANTLAALNEVKDKTPQQILTHIKESVDAFAGDAPQFDDLTMLCLEYSGKNDEMTLDATLENVTTAVNFVGDKAKELNFERKAQYHIEMAVDEIISNVARYAYDKQEGTVDIAVHSDEKCMCITVKDSGVPYNPLEKEDPDVTLSADERGIGGYGIYLVKKVMDEVEYRYENGCNILVMKKYI
ncbi:MAG: SpoIIE family protein phosphatase [Clostridia bacterium]|nr:SpoIIE family protein phosphatase [Clostridia bacterium]